MELRREVRADASVLLTDGTCEFEFSRPRAGVVVVRIAGIDKGHLGQGPMHELRGDLSSSTPLEVFVDAREARLPAMVVQEAWTRWFTQHRSQLKSVRMLVTGKYMHFTVEVVKLLSRTGELIRVYLEPAPYHEALDRAVGKKGPPG